MPRPAPQVSPRRHLAEQAFQRQVEALADLRGWLFYHSHDSRRDRPGFPDLVLVRAPRLLIAELKSARGRVSPAQQEWLAAFRACPGNEVYVWRPGEWAEIERVLF